VSNSQPYEVLTYYRADGRSPFEDWVSALRDKNMVYRIARRLKTLAEGNLGDHKSVGDGVWELRLHDGPGFRIYYGLVGKQVVLLLTGGDKSTQPADIRRAKAYWIDYRQRTAR
jgi:putative addiction module killer protein